MFRLYYNYFSDGHSIISEDSLPLSDICIEIQNYNPDLYYYLEDDILKSIKIELADIPDSINHGVISLAANVINEI